MRYVIITLLVVSGCRGQLIQSNTASSMSTVTTCAFPYSVTSGDIIITTSEWFSSASVPVVSDSLGTSFAQISLKNAGPFAAAYVGTASSSGADTVTFTVSGASFQTTNCAEFSSQFMTATVGQSSTSNTTGSPATASLNLTTAKNGETLFGVVGGFASNSLFAPLNSFYTVTGSNGGDSGAVSFLRSGTNGTYAVGFTNGGSSQVTLLAFSLLPPSGITFTSPSTIPDAVSGTAYQYQMGAVGGTGAYTWSITSGTLQSGLSISSGGLISGTPSATGSKTVTVSVTDGTLTQTKSITIGVGTSFSTVTVVQSASSNAGNVAPFGSNVVMGNMLIVSCTAQFGSQNATSRPSDTISTVYTYLGSMSFLGVTTIAHRYFYYGIAPSSGADTVTCQNIGGNQYFPVISEISGVGTVQDISSITLGTGVTNGTATSNTLTPANANEIIYAVGSAFSSVPTAVTSPFTIVATTVATDMVSKNIVSSTSGITNSYTLSGNTAGTFGIMAVSFPASASSIPVNVTATQIGAFISGP